jgi:signal transduction histidine kinase
MAINQIEHNSHSLSGLGAELVFTQDELGKYHSFYWQPSLIRLNPDDCLNAQNLPCLEPIPKDAYLQRIKRVLTRRIPEQCHFLLRYQNQCLPFELVISPIIPTQGEAQLVLVIGHLVQDDALSLTSDSALPTNPDPYQQLLTKIARRIRSTLDLETIWQQTVDSIGEALQVDRCLLLIPSLSEQILDVKAEYCHPDYCSMLGMRFDLEAEEYQVFKQATFVPQPLTLYPSSPNLFQSRSVLFVSTFYQQQFNGVICLHQCDRPRHWNQAEIELVQELADQVGTAIAHATIYQKLEQATIEAEEASRLKSEFLASTSHELRTPLNGILGSLKLVLDGMADSKEEEYEFVEQAYNSALHLLNLINDILDVAKIEAGKLEFELGNISLNEICEDVYKFAHSQAEKKNIDFKINLPATYDKIILYADYQRLLQVMLNLVGNALKFTHEGEINITTEVITKQVYIGQKILPGVVKISVADTGIGVSLEKQEKLFEKFYQVDGSRTKAYGGTGLGLAISKRLLEAMNGKISFYSMGEYLGSTVTVTIPLSQLPILKTEGLVAQSL